MEPLEIEFNRKQLIFSLVLLVPVYLLVLWTLIYDEKLIPKILIGITAFTAFPCMIQFFLIRFIKNEPAIIITEKGIWDNSTYWTIGWIKWEEIEEIHLNHTFKALSLSIKEPQKFVAKIPSWFARTWTRVNWKFSKKKTINLNHRITKITYLDLLKKIESYQNKNGFFPDLTEHLLDDN